jgi:hypothetical protein
VSKFRDYLLGVVAERKAAVAPKVVPAVIEPPVEEPIAVNPELKHLAEMLAEARKRKHGS